MLRPRGSFYSINMGTIIFSVVLVGASLYVLGGPTKTVFSYFSDNNKQKKIEVYWQEAGLNESNLFEVINNKQCKKTERHFLACVNSLRIVLQNQFQQVSAETGTIVKINAAQAARTEKQALEPFSDMYLRQKESLVDFNTIWRSVLDSAKDDSQKAFFIASGVNSYLSVMKDPHTYLTPTDYQIDMNSSVDRSKLFVGISLEQSLSKIKLRKVYKNSDAANAGLKSGDTLLAFNKQASSQLNLEQISQSLRDPDQKSFQFKVKRQNKVLNITVRRSFTNVKHVQTDLISGFKNYAVITLTKFTRGACDEVQTRLSLLMKESPTGIVLDLRDNPGGYLEEASCIAGLFLGKDHLIYSVQYLNQIRSSEVSITNSELMYPGPLAVLVNSSSASASELLAGAMQEYDRALIIGERTFGKGTFQEGGIWAKNSKISLFKTEGYYLLPSGRSTQLIGVTPDIVIQENTTHRREEDLYYRPLKAKQLAVPVKLISSNKMSKVLGKLEHCIEDNTLNSEDLMLTKGLQVLACQSSGATLAFEQSERD